MKKRHVRAGSAQPGARETMRPEYDFSRGVRGKHARRYASGTNVVVLDPDVAAAFPTGVEVNEALRALAAIILRRKKRATRAHHAA